MYIVYKELVLMDFYSRVLFHTMSACNNVQISLNLQ